MKSKSEVLPVDIGIKAEGRDAICSMLGSVLADQHVLYIKMRNFHWNLVGERFHTLHAFYEEHYRILEGAIDRTAERIRQLGGTAPGSMAEFVKASSLKEAEGELIQGEDSISSLVSDHESVIKSLRRDVGKVEGWDDAGTADFLTALMQDHEKMAWMLRSFLR